MRNRLGHWIPLLFGSMLLLSLMGCAQTRLPATQQGVTISPTLMPTPGSSEKQQTPTEAVLDARFLPTLILTSTATRTIPPTSTPALTPTWTPAPTLSQQDAHTLVQNLLENNGGCQLPCWWGITPGQTEWNTARHFLETFVVNIEQNENKTIIVNGILIQQADYYIVYDVEGGTATSYVFVEDGIVREIEFGENGAQKSFRLHQLLTNYGLPDEIYIHTHSYTSTGDPPPFSFMLYYAQQHFWADFHLEGKIAGDKVIGCPQSSNPRLGLESPDNKWALDALFDYIFGLPSVDGPMYPILTLEEATGMDIGTFTNIFKDPDNQRCLETPVDLWD